MDTLAHHRKTNLSHILVQNGNLEIVKRKINPLLAQLTLPSFYE